MTFSIGWPNLFSRKIERAAAVRARSKEIRERDMTDCWTRRLFIRLKNKVALITGAASGIGREAAMLFADEGAAVVVADVNADAGQGTANLIRERGGRA